MLHNEKIIIKNFNHPLDKQINVLKIPHSVNKVQFKNKRCETDKITNQDSSLAILSMTVKNAFLMSERKQMFKLLNFKTFFKIIKKN